MKSRLALLFLSFLWLAPVTGAGAQTLSARAEVSLLTFSPGLELYATFGHTAFRVSDPAQNLDLVFNYGTFDFNTPDFYLNFIRGKLDYQLTVATYADYERYEVETGRQIREEVLALTSGEKQALSDALFLNARPENRAYRYDFLFDNCATRPRDLLEKALGSRVPWVANTPVTSQTFRDRLDPYLGRMPWTHWGINLLVGVPADRKTTLRESFFLPDALAAGLAGTPLVKTDRIVANPPAPEAPVDWIPGPVPTLSVLALAGLGLGVWEYRRKKRTRLFDTLVFGGAGIVGLIVLFLWLFSDHSSVRPNLNLVWAFPLGLVLASFWKTPPRWFRWGWVVVAGQAVVALVLLALGPWSPQRLDPTAVPLLVLMAGRALWRASAFPHPKEKHP